MELGNETAKYVFPSRRFESRTLEEALMSGTTFFPWFYLLHYLFRIHDFAFIFFHYFVVIFEVPDLETPDFKVLSRNDQYEIRQVEVLYICFLIFTFQYV